KPVSTFPDHALIVTRFRWPRQVAQTEQANRQSISKAKAVRLGVIQSDIDLIADVLRPRQSFGQIALFVSNTCQLLPDHDLLRRKLAGPCQQPLLLRGPRCRIRGESI